MAVAANAERKNFVDWLNKKLRELNTDESVFCSYIIGILEGDENNEEKIDAIEGILSEIIENDLHELVSEILSKWIGCQPKPKDAPSTELYIDVDEQLARMLDKQKLQTTVQRQYTEDELRIREQILSQYSQTEVSEDDDNESGDDGHHSSAPPSGIARNTNAQEVMQLQKERREQLKLDCQRKKEKDKEDREKQKALREEKKEKRRTVKGERRR